MEAKIVTCQLCGEKWSNGSFHVCPRGADVLNGVAEMIGTLQADRTYTAKTVYDKDGMHQLQPDGSIRHILYGEEKIALCTCSAACMKPCKGQCGCSACHDSYQDFLSAE